jgi:hypothetical protein
MEDTMESTTIDTLDTKLPTLSNKYNLIKTGGLIQRVEQLGFKMEKFVALKTRKIERRGYQKHRVIFTSPLMKETSDGIPQLLLTNSHDGTSSVILQLGFFRMVCSNGLVVGSNVVPPIRVRHSGNNFEDKLTIAINTIVAQSQKLNESIEQLKSRQLNSTEVINFQREAIQNRLGKDTKIESFSMPIYRREDEATDLFTVLNVVQENLIRGGARVTVNDNGVQKDKAIRKVSSMLSQMEINNMLWNLAVEKLAA